MGRISTRSTTDILVADQRTHQVLLLSDLDGDGAVSRPEETTVFFEATNASGLPTPTSPVFTFHQAADTSAPFDLSFDGTAAYSSDLTGAATDMIYRIEDLDGSGQIDMAASTVGAGNHFSVFLKDGVLYSAGENIASQLGNGSIGFDVKAPLAVRMPDGFDAAITSVSAGMLHTTFLTDDGDVYAFGFSNRGPLGLGDEESRQSAVKIDALDDVAITGIENGNGVSYAISQDGTLYAWGSNTNGQLGTGDQEERLVPTAVEALADKTVVAVSSGTSHTLALTADGQVYAFGSNTDNQVDGSDDRRVIDPVLVEGLPDDILGVTSDGKTSFAVTSDGRVFGWGQSDEGQLLQGTDNGDGTFTVDPADVAAPVELTGLPDNVIDVKGGARWAVALTDDGDVYAWGPNDEGPTGGLDGDPSVESDVSFRPTKIAELDDVTIVEIQTGPNSIIAVSDTGAVFTWGSNSDGRLGYASDGSVYAPKEVDFDADPAPFLKSATPSDNGRDVENDAALTLIFTEDIEASEGGITLVNRGTAERIEIDVTDDRLVSINGDTVTITPPSHLQTNTSYAVEIEDGAFIDEAGQGFEGIGKGDTSTFNFTTSDEAATSENRYRGTFRDDLLRGGAEDDRISGRAGDDLISGGQGDDRLTGNWGDDHLRGDTGSDRLNGGWGRDTLDGGEGDELLEGGWSDDVLLGGGGDDRLRGGVGDDLLDGGAGDDRMRGGLGVDTFVFNGGADVIEDFDAGFDWWIFSRASDQVVIDIDGIEGFEELIAGAGQTGSAVTFQFSEDDSLTLRNVDMTDLEADMFSFL